MGYEESGDGFHWVKPPLRLHEYEGTLDNSVCRLEDTGGYVWGMLTVVQDQLTASARGDRRFEAIGPTVALCCGHVPDQKREPDVRLPNSPRHGRVDRGEDGQTPGVQPIGATHRTRALRRHPWPALS